MTDDVMQAAMATWASMNLPARLDVVTTAKLLGFAESDIQVLMSTGKLTPLGDPAPNAPKWFAAVAIIRLAADHDWLHKATKDVAKFWRNKRERRVNPLQSSYVRSEQQQDQWRKPCIDDNSPRIRRENEKANLASVK